MKLLLVSSILAVGILSSPLAAQDAPFGTDADADYAALLWDVMESANLVGENAIRVLPYEGAAPAHGRMLTTVFAQGTVSGQTGDLIIKNNYGPEGISAEEILAEPGKFLGAVTVMFRREAGFDEDNSNWFWVKYLPDGTLDKNPAGMRMAGRIAKGADAGCIACHVAEDDRVFLNNY